MSSGIYGIMNLINGKIYVGSATDINKRKYRHFRDLRDGAHWNKYLQSSFNKNGESNFLFDVLEYVTDKGRLVEREQYWFSVVGCGDKERCYNLCFFAGSRLGLKHTEKTKNRWRRLKKGIPRPKSVIEKITKTNRMVCRTNSFREKMSAIATGGNNGQSVFTDKAIASIRRELWKGEPIWSVARKHNSSASNVSLIKANKAWRHVTIEEATNEQIAQVEQRYMGEKAKKLTERDVIEIRTALNNGETGISIARAHGLAASTVSSIKRRETWNHI